MLIESKQVYLNGSKSKRGEKKITFWVKQSFDRHVVASRLYLKELVLCILARTFINVSIWVSRSDTNEQTFRLALKTTHGIVNRRDPGQSRTTY